MTYLLLFIPIIVALLAQAIKALVDLFMGRFSFSSFHNYGGIPSGHSAFISSAATIMYFIEGVHSPAFILSVLIAIIVFRDAVTLRQNMGIHATVLNQLIKELPDKKEFAYPVLPERLGHTVTQVLAGIVTGVGLTTLIYFLLV